MFLVGNSKVDAFVACGGKTDKSGFVRKETLVKIIKGDFGLTINIEVLTEAGALTLPLVVRSTY